MIKRNLTPLWRVMASLLVAYGGLVTTVQAQMMHQVEGFEYGQVAAPSGTEWESPERLSLNKEQPRAYFFSFKNVDAARGFLPEEGSAYYKSLNGEWKFNYVGNPSERPVDFYRTDFNDKSWATIPVPSNWEMVGIQKDGTYKYGIPIYSNQRYIFQHTVAVDDWRGGVMRTPPEHWATFEKRNEVGSYRTTFEVPADWKEREVYLNFDGVSSFFYLWLNGKYIGFGKNSRNTATFDLTPYLQKGENLLAVEVYRSSDASFLEDQDMFRLSGIFRDVYLTSVPKAHLRDLAVTPQLDADYTNGKLHIRGEVRNLLGKRLRHHKLRYTLYQNELYTQENKLVDGATVELPIPVLQSGEVAVTETDLFVQAPAKWSAEEPHLYTLVAELLDRRGRAVQVSSVVVGFRQVEIRETPAEEDEFGLAGRYYYINGMPVKLKGVNRHEMNPETGYTLSKEQLVEEIMLMKRGNINHVRLAHYNNIPLFYYLSDLYGLYLEDEANIESHGYYYGKASLSHVPEFRRSHVARVREMVASHINHPSIVIWSLGNEGGPGVNFEHAYDAIKEFDKSRPVQYERNNHIVDMGSNQYPSIAWMREAVKGTYNIVYPFHVSEYAHNMGNAGGNLKDYWDAIESTNFFCGAAIWDWKDQALYTYDSGTGERYLGYGGDFGDHPNDGMFSMNGVVFADLEPKPAFFEVKKVYQNVGISEEDLDEGTIRIFNKRYFTNLDDLTLHVKLLRGGVVVAEEEIPMPSIAPRTSEVVTTPFTSQMVAEWPEETFINVELRLKSDAPWADAGYVQMEEQIPFTPVRERILLADEAADYRTLTAADAGSWVGVMSDRFTAIFDNVQGTLQSYKFDGKQMIKEDCGPRLTVLRAPVDNDNWAYQTWFEKGLHQLEHTVTHHEVNNNADGSVSILYNIVSQAPHGNKLEGGVSGRYKLGEEVPTTFRFTTTQVFTIYQDGSIALSANISSNEEGVSLPRIGYAMELPKSLHNYKYYGRGPWNNYNDRLAGAHVGLYESTVEEQFVNFPKPQSMGNREDVRWVELTDDEGAGLAFIALPLQMSASALPWSALEMTFAPHPHQLPEPSGTHLVLSYGTTGLGGNSCGQGPPLLHDRIFSKDYNFTFVIRPAGSNKRITQEGLSPLSIRRSNAGEIVIDGGVDAPAVEGKIIYAIAGEDKEHAYTQSFTSRDAITIKAWREETPWLVTERSFDKIEGIPMTIHKVSSQETSGGAAENLLDHNPSTIWHSMYSVTVASYPHWVELDAGAEQLIRGFQYLPRQDHSNNGNVKEYSFQVSQDGENWSEPLAGGTFENGKQIQEVLLEEPVKARYVRFNALSSQNGQDYAAAAELVILAD